MKMSWVFVKVIKQVISEEALKIGITISFFVFLTMMTAWIRYLLCAVALTASVALIPTWKEPSTRSGVVPQRRLSQQTFDPATVELKGPVRAVRRLEFVHITKNGGSAIEKAAAKAGVIWGACHYREWANLGCAQPDWPKQFNKMRPPEGEKPYHGEPWHAPHYWLDPPVYGDAATFAVIRNPYDRIISEYHYFEGAIHGSSHDPSKMNEWITIKLNDYQAKTYFGGHFLPQHSFVYDTTGKLMIDHVVRYENLSEEFASLMKVYKLPIELPEKKRHFRDNTSKYFTKEHLTDSTIRLINDFYNQDFELLGYPMVSAAAEFKTE